jgi:hypothetical protein
VTAIAIRKDGGRRDPRGWTRCTTPPLTTGGFTLVSLAVLKGMATRDTRSLVSDTIRRLPGDRQLRPNQPRSFAGHGGRGPFLPRLKSRQCRSKWRYEHASVGEPFPMEPRDARNHSRYRKEITWH